MVTPDIFPTVLYEIAQKAERESIAPTAMAIRVDFEKVSGDSSLEIRKDEDSTSVIIKVVFT